MSSDPPPDSLAFDDLWATLPVAPLSSPPSSPSGHSSPASPSEDPRPARSVRLPSSPSQESSKPTLPPDNPRREEDRATIAPPVPPQEYVRAMMELGELDDFEDLASASRTASLRPDRPTPTPSFAESDRATVRPDEPLDFGDRRDTRDDDLSAAFPGPPRRLGVAKEPAQLRRTQPKAPSVIPAAARRKSYAPIPIAPVPRLAPLRADLKELDTLEGLGPLPDDLFEAFAAGEQAPFVPAAPPAPPPPPPSATRASARPGPPKLGRMTGATRERAPTPTGMRLRVESLEALSDDEESGPSSFEKRVADMRGLLSASNFSSALVVAESVLVADPNHAAAKSCVETCRAALADKYLGSLGGPQALAHVSMSAEEIRWLALDHRSGFLLSFVDGSSTIQDVLDMCSMPELDALRILFDLRTQGVIEVAPPIRRPGRR